MYPKIPQKTKISVRKPFGKFYGSGTATTPAPLPTADLGWFWPVLLVNLQKSKLGDFGWPKKAKKLKPYRRKVSECGGSVSPPLWAKFPFD